MHLSIIISITGLFKTFLVVVIFFMIIRLLSKLLSLQNPEYRHNSYQNNQPKDGETTIHVKDQEKKNSHNKKGEYVDFDEIE
jgi:biopolymer transport protein ExbD